MMREKSLSPRTLAKREHIRAIAQELFLQQGFERTTMDMVALTARVSKQTLYRYYQSKEGLFADILEQLTREQVWQGNLWEGVMQMMERPDHIEQACITLAQRLVASLMQPSYLALVRMVLAEGYHFPHLVALFRSTVIEQGVRDLVDGLERAQAQGYYSATDPKLWVRLFIGPLLTFVLADGLFAPESTLQPPPPETIAEVVRLSLRALTWPPHCVPSNEKEKERWA